MPNLTDTKITTPKAGHPFTQIPPEIGEWCEMSYSAGKNVEIPAEPDSEDAREFLRLVRIYASRQTKKVIDSEYVNINGEWFLRFRMRDRRKYQFKAAKETNAK